MDQRHSHYRRRRVLAMLSSAGVGSIAGCTGDDSESSDEAGGDDESDTSGEDPAFDVPTESTIDRPIEIELTGLPSNVDVRIDAVSDDPATGDRWSAEATFETDEDGRVNLAEQAPVEGDYDGVDPMGLFWAKEADAPPVEALFPWVSYDVTLSAWDGDDELARTTTSRVFPDVETEPFEGDVVGTIHFPPDDDSAPGVLLLHGSGGNPLDQHARLLADRGFVAGSIQYFGEPDSLPDGLIEVPVEYVEAAIEQLRAHDRVGGDDVGLYGASKGAEYAFLAGAHLEGIGAIATMASSGLVWEGLTAEWVEPDASSWSVDGEPVPYVPYAEEADDVETNREYYDAALEEADEETIEAATIPIERADAPILAVSGGDDDLWDAVGLTEIAFDRLDEHDYPREYDHLVYEDAGHSITPPFRPTYGLSVTPRLALGGSPEATAEASRDHWPRVLSLFEDALGD